MTDTPASPEEGTRPRRGGKGRRRKPRARRKGLLIAAWATAGVVVLGGSGLGYAYWHLNHNIKGVDIDAALGKDRPADTDNGSMDILVLGSDSRSGSNGEYGRDEGSARSDTAMVVHVYEGHKKASVVSIPRDTLVDRPVCATDGGKTVPAAHQAMFNSAYSAGGPACAVKTVESMSGIRMDHYVEVDFTGFKRLVDALGGVPLTTTKPIQDTSSHLSLAAGRHTLDGEQSLGLVRTRHGVGDGSDLGRIQLQQAFVKALIDRVKHVGVLGNPAKAYKLAGAATSALTTDSGLDSVRGLATFGTSLKGVKTSATTMVTLPVAYDPQDANRVLPDTAKDTLLWKALRADKAVPAAAEHGTTQGGADGVVKG
ncbi:LCP family protein [Streptomyces sp. NPDC088925]|uniref:LCP family protein n=1 Tax=Streptomyces sp. NPDC088925 TaxID=3365914 RepID=UPI0037FF29A1